MDDDEVHVFSNYSSAESFIRQLEKDTSSSFVKRHAVKVIQERTETLKNHRILFEDKRGEIVVPFSGIPFCILQTEVRECHQGPQKKRKETVSEDDHCYFSSKQSLQSSKKVGCQMKIKMRMVVHFPDYETKKDTEWLKRQVKEKLKEEFDSKTSQKFSILLKVFGQHTGHLIEDFSGYGLPVGKEAKCKIKEMVNDGIVSVSTIKGILVDSAKKEGVSPLNRSFYPTNQDIRNHKAQAVRVARFSSDDQENLNIFLKKRELEHPTDTIFYRPSTDNGEFLLVYQTKFQRSLLEKYGEEFVLMDSTYKTTKYELPLFQLSVCSNIGFLQIGFFIVLNETKQKLMEALNILKEWNKNWQPKSFMCDYDTAEIGAVESTFEDCRVFTCDFHREQAWLRWFQKKENTEGYETNSVLQQLRAIARANSPCAYNDAVEKLKDMTFYKKSKKFQYWMKNFWLKDHLRWVQCFRQHYVNVRIGTTNGIEWLHKNLKEKYLQQFNQNSTISSLISVLLNQFIPDHQERYIRANVMCQSQYRLYNKIVPTFLQDRPRPFVLHCMKRWNHPVEICSMKEEGLFIIKDDSTREYEVNLNGCLPSCTCFDWLKFHWPCKHMLAIFYQRPEYGWQYLSSEYTGLPIFNIDKDVLKTNAQFQENVLMTAEPHEDMQDQIVTTSPATEITHTKQPKPRPTDCLETIKNITTCIHCIEDDDDICTLHSMLTSVQDFAFKVIPKLDKLPVRSQKKTLKKQKQILKCPAENETSNKLPAGIEWKCSKRDEELLNKMWSDKNTNDAPSLKVGPYILTHESFTFAKSTLSDELIDAFMRLRTKDMNKVLYIDCVLFTAIFEDQRGVFNQLKKEKLLLWETVVGIYNQGGNHWTLMKFLKNKREYATTRYFFKWLDH